MLSRLIQFLDTIIAFYATCILGGALVFWSLFTILVLLIFRRIGELSPRGE